MANPARNQLLCDKLLLAARAELLHERWAEAIPYYGTAFEASQLLLNPAASAAPASPDNVRQQQYLRIALELIYACRKCRHTIDLAELIELTKRPLALTMAPIPLQQLMAPLIDVAFSPLPSVDQWMRRLLAVEEARMKGSEINLGVMRDICGM